MDQDVREFLEQMAGMMAREFARINGRLDNIEARLDSIEARLDSIEARLDRVEARLDGIDGRLASHDRRLDRLESQYYDMRRETKSEFALVRHSIDALTLRVGAIEQRA